MKGGKAKNAEPMKTKPKLKLFMFPLVPPSDHTGKISLEFS